MWAGGLEGWGECEAAPLVSIASWICPMSHSACHPVIDSVVGQVLDSPADIERIGNLVRAGSLDLLQADHTLSGIDIAMWDLLGKRMNEPVYRLLGYPEAHPKTPYASVLFGDTAEQTFAKAREIRAAGYTAAKFGWGPFGLGSVEADEAQVRAARDGLGEEAILLVDVGTVWVDDVARAGRCLPVLKECRATWLEEPFVSGALDAYAGLARQSAPVRLAGGEGAHNYWMARHMIDYAGIGFVQIDTGRIGGITPARRVAAYAASRGVTYVNHTFTTPLALNASIQPFAGLKEHVICEYPIEAKPVARDLTVAPAARDAAGQVRLPEAPGLGVEVNLETVRKYCVDVEIRAKGKVLYRTPAV
jgi:L-alanine-DL-glutamate epimerase-like enolase superfamily enzyme